MAGYLFGQMKISLRVVFYQTPLSFAFTNIKPIVPGHVLVSSVRVVPRFEDLTKDEVADLFQCVHAIAPKLQAQFNATSLTIAIQDGKDAGQTVPHVHVHMLPRKSNDFNQNDEIYAKLEEHDKDQEKFRGEDEMSMEAEMLRKLFL
jgi:bis(5'-adenosyl)-triphosphatase